MENHVFVDTETTGFAQSDEITGMAVISADGDVLFNSRFENPKKPLNEGCPLFADCWDDIACAVSGRTVIGHNIENYDLRMIDQTARAYGISDPLAPFSEILDTRRLAKVAGHGDHMSLENLCHAYGFLGDQPHRALEDAFMNRFLYDRLTDDLTDRFGADGAQEAIRNSITLTRPATERLLLSGAGIREAAELSGKLPSTIADYAIAMAETGTIDLSTLISDEDTAFIKAISLSTPDFGARLRPIMDRLCELGFAYGYDAIRLAIARRETTDFPQVKRRPLAMPELRGKNERMWNRFTALAAICEGKSTDAAAKQTMLAPSTVEGYVQEWVEDGILPADAFCLPALAKIIRTVAEGMPGRNGRLKPVFDFFAALGLTVSYLQIKIALIGENI